MPYREKLVQKAYFNITEVCDIINEQLKIPKGSPREIVTSTLRYWEAQFPGIIQVKRDGKGARNRKYSRDAVLTLVKIARLSDSGNYTIKGIRDELTLLPSLYLVTQLFKPYMDGEEGEDDISRFFSSRGIILSEYADGKHY